MSSAHAPFRGLFNFTKLDKWKKEEKIKSGEGIYLTLRKVNREDKREVGGGGGS